MRPAAFERLGNDEVILGIAIAYANPACIESIAKGWDWVFIDGQHGQHDYTSVLRAVQLCEHCGVAAVTRSCGHEPGIIAPLLDTGSHGLVVPMVDTPEQARATVHAACFPPLGERSYGGRRMGDREGREYFLTANEHLLLIPQIETPEALDNVEEIAAVDGVDCLFIGPVDMKIRMGIPIGTAIQDSEELTRAMARTAEAARSAGKSAGCVVRTPAELKTVVALGYRFIVGSFDFVLLADGASAKLDDLRRALSNTP